MRITPSMQNRNFLENIDAAKARVDKAQSQISSGKRVNQLSDDPFAASQASRIASVMSVNDQLIANNDLLRNKLELTDSVLQSLNDTFDNAKSIAVQALSGTTSAESRSALATAMKGVRSKVLSAASAQFNGMFIFSGTLTSTEPFQDSGGTVTFHGNDEPLLMRIDRTTVIKSNITNEDLFAGPPSIFGVLDSLPAAIEANDTDAIRASLRDLETIANRVNTSAAVVGSNIQLVDQAQSAQESQSGIAIRNLPPYGCRPGRGH
jgi:flagellar hook-associated protein 3 FlgL